MSARKLLRFAVLAIMAMVISAASAYAVAAYAERIHAARSEIVFDVQTLPGNDTERFLETQLVIAQSRAILAPVADAHGIPITDLERAFSVATVRNSAVIRLEYHDPDPQLARTVTRAITDRYLVSLRDSAPRDGPVHRLLTPAFLLEEPVSLEPLRAMAIGAAIGLSIAIGAAIIRTQAWSA